MKSIPFFSFLIGIANAAMWIIFGLLIRNKFDALITYIVRKPMPSGLIPADKHQSIQRSIRLVGTLLIIIGICKALITFVLTDLPGL